VGHLAGGHGAGLDEELIETDQAHRVTGGHAVHVLEVAAHGHAHLLDVLHIQIRLNHATETSTKRETRVGAVAGREVHTFWPGM
jgi:hypothetical protein